MESKPDRPKARRWLFVAAPAVFLGSMFWLAVRLTGDTTHRAPEAPASRVSAAAGEVPAPHVEVAKPVGRPSTPSVHARTEAGEVSKDEAVEPVEPHPIDAERAALLPPWATFEEVWGALEKRDFERARTLLERRQAEDPQRDEWADFYLGLDIVRECMQAPDAENRARAEGFLDKAQFRASPLRRHVRRHCIAAERAAVRAE